MLAHRLHCVCFSFSQILCSAAHWTFPDSARPCAHLQKSPRPSLLVRGPMSLVGGALHKTASLGAWCGAQTN